MSAAETQPGFAAKVRWPLVVIGLLGVHVAVMVVGLVAAFAIPGAVVTTTAYDHALRWDELQADRRASEALGWSLSANVSETAEWNGDRSVTFRLVDASGLLVRDAKLHLRIYHHARPGRLIEEQLAETAPGNFTATFPLRRDGLWRFEAVAVAGDNQYLSESDLWIGSELSR
ncbi:MAG: FixH family protein [Planctomycetota bacterium]